mgnify:CR=1 FL=1
MAEPDDDIFSRWGVGGGEKPKPKSQGKLGAPVVVESQPASMDQFSNWQLGSSAPRVLVETPDGLIDRATGAKVPAAEASPDEILKRVPQQTMGQKLAGSTRATIHGAVNAVPVAGPYLVDIANSLAAMALEKSDGIPRAEAMRRIQEMQARDATNNPAASFGGNMLGAAGSLSMASSAIPGAARVLGITGPTMRARMAAGAGSGAALAGGDAMVRGNDPFAGMAFGGVGGAAGPPVGALLGAGANKLVNAVQYIMPTQVNGVSRPAANLMGQIIAADEPAAVQASLARLGPQAMLMDAGPSMTNVGGGLATKPGEPQSVVMNALRQRAAGANSRLADDLNASIGTAPVPSQVEGGIRAAQQALSPQYTQALAGARAVNTQPLADALDAEVANLRGPAQRAVRDVRAMLDIPGTNHLDPHPRALLSTRHAIDGLLETEQNSTVIAQLTAARRRIDTELTRAVPGIKDVDAQFQELARQNTGLALGGRVLDSGKTAIRPQEMRQQFQEAAIPAGNMVGPSATPMRIQEGARAEIDRLVGTKANDLVALRQALQGEGGWNTDKLSTLFGEQRANRLLNAVGREAQFADTTQTITRNSETARRVSANKLLESADPESTNYTGSTLGGLALQGAKNMIVNPIMKMIMQSNNEPMRNELARIMTLQGPARDIALNQLIRFAQRQAATSAAASKSDRLVSQGANSLLLSAPVAGRQVESR